MKRLKCTGCGNGNSAGKRRATTASRSTSNLTDVERKGKRLKCTGCGWEFIVGNRLVFGPIFEDQSAEAVRVMPRDEFADGYGDCNFKEIPR